MSGLDGLGWPNPEDEPKPTKSMSDTPETDAEVNELKSATTYNMVWAEFARKLERERDEARERADTMFAKHANILDEARNKRDEARGQLREEQRLHVKTLNERDEAIQARKDSAADWLNQVRNADFRVARIKRERDRLDDQLDQTILRLGGTQERMIDAERQRDRLIKSVEPLKYWRDISECDCSNPLPQGGCLRCDLNRILKTTNPNEL
jgi:chromosome segregation ATPase